MKILKGLLTRSGEAGELITFLWKAKMWFLIPFIAVLLIFGLIFVFANATGVAPFIYTLI